MGILYDLEQAKWDYEVALTQLREADPDMQYAASLRVAATKERYDVLCKRAKAERVAVTV